MKRVVLSILIVLLLILLIGPFFLASSLPDLNYFSAQAEACNFDRYAYRAALHRLPFLSRHRVEHMMSYYVELFHALAESGIRRIEQQRNAHAVIQSEARWRSLVTSAPAFIATIGRNGVILFLNRAPANQPLEKLIGANLYDLLPESEAAKTRSALQTVFETGQTLEYETQIPQPDGSRQWFKHNVGPVMLDGAVSAAMFISTDISETKRTEARLSYLSTHDVLTGLYNRAYFESELLRLQAEGPFPISIIMADVDGMKQANDYHGHAAGDDLLRRVAQVLHQAFRQQGIRPVTRLRPLKGPKPLARGGVKAMEPAIKTAYIQPALMIRRRVAPGHFGRIDPRQFPVGSLQRIEPPRGGNANRRLVGRSWEAAAAERQRPGQHWRTRPARPAAGGTAGTRSTALHQACRNRHCASQRSASAYFRACIFFTP